MIKFIVSRLFVSTEYKTVEAEVIFELIEKRSRFVASLSCVSSQAEAETYLCGVKKKHYSAKHNVYAYILASGQEKFSDDGEPSGTGGQPVLGVLKKNELCNAICVVSRYFGGILLGRGGLLRAYSSAAVKAVECAKIVEMVECDYCKIACDYPFLDSVLSVLKKSDIFLEKKIFNQTVDLYVFSELPDTGNLKANLKNISGGKVGFEILGRKLRRIS